MRILIIEDDQRVSQFIEKGLEEQGYDVITAKDGIKGLNAAKADAPDLIILDLMLAGMDGFELLSELRKTDNSTPVLILSAKSDLDDRVRGLDLGADDYLVKPFAFEELMARIRAISKRTDRESSQALIAGSLRMDLISRELTREAKKIILTQKEFSILEYLIRNQGKVLSREMITQKVWGGEASHATNIVDVYINYIRNKINKDFDKKLIRTIKGAGYILEEENV